ncbi:hypothetical protein BB560_004077, partial [Smittium megazygosporum]
MSADGSSHWKTRRFVVTDEQVARYKRRLDLLGSRPMSPNFRRFRLFTHALAFSSVVYIVLFHDFGDRWHIYTPIREWYNSKVQGFWSLSDKEIGELKDR